jgi:hypothetical protein
MHQDGPVEKAIAKEITMITASCADENNSATRIVRARQVLASLSLLAAVACGDTPIGPQTLAGQYELAGAEAVPLPVILQASESCEDRLVGGVLTIDSSGGFTLLLNLEEDCTRGGGGIQQRQQVDTGSFTLEDGTLTFAVESSSTSRETITGVVVSADHIRVTVTDLDVTGHLDLAFMRSDGA